MKKLYTLSFALLALSSFGQTFTATYDFAGIPSSATNGLTDPTPPPTVSGLTFSYFTALNSDTSLNSGASGRFSYTKQPLGAVASSNVYTDHTGVLDSNTYFTFIITPTSGTVFDLSKITFKSQRSATGIRTYAVRSSADGYTANLPASVSPINPEISVETGNISYRTLDATTTAQNGSTITLSGASFTGISTPITFRIYGWNAETTSGTFSVDDVAITGTITTLSVKQNEIAGLSIYPNPVTKGTLYITSNSNSEKSVTVFDVLGKQVLNSKTSNNAVNVANLKSGIYILKITEDEKIDTRKLIIE
jgi:hypothetical protein